MSAVYTKRGRDVAAGYNSDGTARRVDNAEMATLLTEYEREIETVRTQAVNGPSWLASVRVATTANGTLSTAFDNASTVDGVTLATNDRILIKDQSDATVNGIYVVQASGNPVRATDADTAAELLRATVLVKEGTVNAGSKWICNNTAITLGSTNIVFVELDNPVANAPEELDGLRAKGSDIASATTTDIGAATGDLIDITGTTTITGFGTVAAGVERTVRFTGILTLTHNATSLILPTGANIVTAAGDRAIMRSLGSGNWLCVVYGRADGTALAASNDLARTISNNGVRSAPIRIERSLALAEDAATVAEINRRINAIMARNPTHLYCRPAGNSTAPWDSVYTTLAAALAAANGPAVIHCSASAASPFRPEAISDASLPDYIWVMADLAGPDGACVGDGARTATWTNASGDIYYCTPTGTVQNVAYDLQQDDAEGSVTGIDLTTPEIVAALRDAGLDTADVLPWYGWMTWEGSGGTSPTPRFWQLDGGTLYGNFPDASNVGDVNTNARYVNGDSLFRITKPGGTHRNFVMTGPWTLKHTPATNNSGGYLVRMDDAYESVVSGIRGWNAGYHAVGFVGDSGRDNIIHDCSCSGMAAGSVPSGSTNPFVMYSDAIGVESFRARGTRLFYLGYPLLGHDGAPIEIYESGNHVYKFAASIAYSHSALSVPVSGNYFRGMVWANLWQIDLVDMLEQAHSITITTTRNSVAADRTNDTPVAGDPDSYSVKVIGLVARGRCAWPGPGVEFRYSLFDRTRLGDDTPLGSTSLDLFNFATTGYSVRLFEVTMLTGEHKYGWTNIATGDLIDMEFCRVLIQSSAVGSGLFHTTDTYSDLIRLRCVTFDALDTDAAILVANNAVFSTAHSIIDSQGGNQIGATIVAPYRNFGTDATQDNAWWQTNVAAASDIYNVADLNLAA